LHWQESLVVVSSAMPKPAAANAAVTHIREIANGLFLVLFFMHHGMMYNDTLNLFNEAVKYQQID
jgi:Kef-type K+ transport system membrane component KefB